MVKIQQDRIQGAAYECREAIYARYDAYAQDNIANFRLNLDTGNPYTQGDLDAMNAFIDAHRTHYQEIKTTIEGLEIEDERELSEYLKAMDLSFPDPD